MSLSYPKDIDRCSVTQYENSTQVYQYTIIQTFSDFSVVKYNKKFR